VAEATAALQQDGLSVAGVLGDPTHNVFGVRPPVGTTVEIGSSVTLYTK
jgi:beta-lactam-binding protein with PASTA domain